jgi:hypothetical protein
MNLYGIDWVFLYHLDNSCFLPVIILVYKDAIINDAELDIRFHIVWWLKTQQLDLNILQFLHAP